MQFCTIGIHKKILQEIIIFYLIYYKSSYTTFLILLNPRKSLTVCVLTITPTIPAISNNLCQIFTYFSFMHTSSLFKQSICQHNLPFFNQEYDLINPKL